MTKAPNQMDDAGAAGGRDATALRFDEMLRQALGEALTSKLAELCEDGAPDWFDARHVDQVLDVVMPLAAPAPAQDAAATMPRAPRAFRTPEPGTPWWQTAKDCGAWTDRQDGDVGYVHFGSVEALRVYTVKISNQARAAMESAPPPVPATDDPIHALLAKHQALLADSERTYFELAYTRPTGFMAWITDKPLASTVVNPDRKVLVSGQGDTAAAACANALQNLAGNAESAA